MEDNEKKKQQGLEYRICRIKKHLHQSDVATAIGVSQKFISDIERGLKSSPRVVRLLNEFYHIEQ